MNKGLFFAIFLFQSFFIISSDSRAMTAPARVSFADPLEVVSHQSNLETNNRDNLSDDREIHQFVLDILKKKNIDQNNELFALKYREARWFVKSLAIALEKNSLHQELSTQEKEILRVYAQFD